MRKGNEQMRTEMADTIGWLRAKTRQAAREIVIALRRAGDTHSAETRTKRRWLTSWTPCDHTRVRIPVEVHDAAFLAFSAKFSLRNTRRA